MATWSNRCTRSLHSDRIILFSRGYPLFFSFVVLIHVEGDNVLARNLCFFSIGLDKVLDDSVTKIFECPDIAACRWRRDDRAPKFLHCP